MGGDVLETGETEVDGQGIHIHLKVINNKRQHAYMENQAIPTRPRHLDALPLTTRRGGRVRGGRGGATGGARRGRIGEAVEEGLGDGRWGIPHKASEGGLAVHFSFLAGQEAEHGGEIAEASELLVLRCGWFAVLDGGEEVGETFLDM